MCCHPRIGWQSSLQTSQHRFVSSVRCFTDSSGILADGNERWTQNNPIQSERICNSLQPLKFQGVVRKLISKIGSLIENANGLVGTILTVSWKGHSSGLLMVSESGTYFLTCFSFDTNLFISVKRSWIVWRSKEIVFDRCSFERYQALTPKPISTSLVLQCALVGRRVGFFEKNSDYVFG